MEYQGQLDQDVGEDETAADALPAELVTVGNHDSGTELAKPLVQKGIYPLELKENLYLDYDLVNEDRITRIHHEPRVHLYTPSENKLKQWGLGAPMTRITVIEMRDGTTKEITHSYEEMIKGNEHPRPEWLFNKENGRDLQFSQSSTPTRD